MNINLRIESALCDVTQNIWPLCCPLEEKPEEYIVYNPELETPEMYADDEGDGWTQYMQVHLYTKYDYTEQRKKIRKNLNESGMVVTDIDTGYEKATKYYHLCFSCYAEEEE